METVRPESTVSVRSRIGLILGLIGAGGCLGLIVLAVFLVVLFFQDAAKKCPPQDFPVYPGAQQTDFNYETSGSSSRCSAGWQSEAASTEVSTFYEANLSTGAWRLVSKDPQGGFWYFERRTDASTIGRMSFAGSGTQTRIEVQILTGQSPAPSASP